MLLSKHSIAIRSEFVSGESRQLMPLLIGGPHAGRAGLNDGARLNRLHIVHHIARARDLILNLEGLGLRAIVRRSLSGIRSPTQAVAAQITESAAP